ncbi:MAG: glutathione S-transferase N-terminal domain-containing protein [Pseudomonas sp.]|jgi:glutathione S-transferase
MIKIYGVHGSPLVRKVLAALNFTNIPYEIVAQIPFSGDKDDLKINALWLG